MKDENYIFCPCDDCKYQDSWVDDEDGTVWDLDEVCRTCIYGQPYPNHFEPRPPKSDELVVAIRELTEAVYCLQGQMAHNVSVGKKIRRDRIT